MTTAPCDALERLEREGIPSLSFVEEKSGFFDCCTAVTVCVSLPTLCCKREGGIGVGEVERTAPLFALFLDPHSVATPSLPSSALSLDCARVGDGEDDRRDRGGKRYVTACTAVEREEREGKEGSIRRQAHSLTAQSNCNEFWPPCVEISMVLQHRRRVYEGTRRGQRATRGGEGRQRPQHTTYPALTSRSACWRRLSTRCSDSHDLIVAREASSRSIKSRRGGWTRREAGKMGEVRVAVLCDSMLFIE